MSDPDASNQPSRPKRAPLHPAVAAHLKRAGQKGGLAKSEAKTKAVRTNAQTGGRPKGSKDTVARVRSCKRKNPSDVPPNPA